MKSPFKNNHFSRPAMLLMAGLVASVVLIFILGTAFKNPFLKAVDFAFYDQFSKQAVSTGTISPVTIVDIDETSLSAVGQWPWPRYRMAQLISIVEQANPRAIGLDIIFPESDQTSLKVLQQQFLRDFNLTLGFTGVPSTLMDNDGFFGHMLQQSRTVGARYFYFDHFNKDKGCRNNPFRIVDKSGLLSPHRATGVLCNTAALEDRLAFNGSMNNQHDEDGILRQTPLLIEFQGRLYPHLSLSTFMKAENIGDATVERDLYGLFIQAGEHRIPINRNGYFRTRFNGPARRQRYISGVELLNGNYDKSALSDRIVFLGSSAVGLNDIHHTVFDTQFPGIEVHAAILENIFNRQFMIIPIWSQSLILAVCILTAVILTTLFFLSKGAVVLLTGSALWMLLLLVTSFGAFTGLSVFVSPGIPLLLSITLFTFFSLSRFALEKRASYTWYRKLVDSQQLTLRAMVSMVETRDPETGEHIKRTQLYARMTAETLRNQGFYQEVLTDRFIATLFLSVPLHDIGKVGIPDNILLKPERLTDDEYEIMKTHAAHGRTIITRATKDYKIDAYLLMSAEIAGTHHERWDGKGYPDGIGGDQIPLSGRIMSLADVYDALISVRCYKPAFSHEKAIGIIREGRGTLFDPVIVDAFLAIESDIGKVAAALSDAEEVLTDG
ncbi:CHASE2 domain-containing protein [bacterium]|nr:CHASE2 domain-containing protein [bacterium]